MIKLLTLLGAFFIAGASTAPLANINNNKNEKLNQTMATETDVFYYTSLPYGLSENVLEVTFMKDFVNKLNDYLLKNNQSIENVKSIEVGLTSTALSANNDGLAHALTELLDGGKIISEKYQTIARGNGNYEVDLSFSYETKTGELNTAQVNTFTTLFNEYQLENGSWTLTLEFEFTQKDIENIDDQYNSNIKLPDYGFEYYAHQITEMFNNHLESNSAAKAVIEQNKEIKIENLTANDIYSAVFNEEKYELGVKYEPKVEITDKYFYVAFTTDKIPGTYYMLIQNIDSINAW